MVLAQYAGCRQKLLEKAVGARRKKVRLHMSRLQDFKALWRVWGSFGSGGASALAELLLKRPTELIFCVQTRAFRITRGRLSGLGK